MVQPIVASNPKSIHETTTNAIRLIVDRVWANSHCVPRVLAKSIFGEMSIRGWHAATQHRSPDSNLLAPLLAMVDTMHYGHYKASDCRQNCNFCTVRKNTEPGQREGNDGYYCRRHVPPIWVESGICADNHDRPPQLRRPRTSPSPIVEPAEPVFSAVKYRFPGVARFKHAIARKPLASSKHLFQRKYPDVACRDSGPGGRAIRLKRPPVHLTNVEPALLTLSDVAIRTR